MTDIAKLKQEAEEARENLIRCIHVYIDIPERNAGYIADSLMTAFSKQIALQAAEKEAEARKYDEDRRKAALMALSDEVKASIIPQVIAEQCRYMPDIPAPIADDGWVKWPTSADCFHRRDEPCYSNLSNLTDIEVKFKNGEVYKGKRSHFSWKRHGLPNDIIAYRIIQPAADRVEE